MERQSTNTITLISMEHIIPKGNNVVIADLSAASYWGYSNYMNDKAYINVKKGYNNIKWSKDLVCKKQLIKRKLFKNIEEVYFENKKFLIQNKEASFVQVIKRLGTNINDQAVEFMKSFFSSNYNHKRLIQIAIDNNIEKEIIMAERIING